MTKEQILAALEEQQEIQMHNSPSSQAWQAASKRLHELVEMLTGKPCRDACGR